MRPHLEFTVATIFMVGKSSTWSELTLQGAKCIEQCTNGNQYKELRSSRRRKRTEATFESWVASLRSASPKQTDTSSQKAIYVRFTASVPALATAVYQTPYGPFDGDSWEKLCQQVFKKKFVSEGYQHIPATPGDFGLEGFTISTGSCFQCYCPDAAYSGKELHEKQRDKVTEDLKKLKKHEAQLKNLLGTTKLRRWYFVTPTIARNELIKHARLKEAEVRAWGLSILAPDFEVLVQDGDHYATEIQQLQLAFGNAMDFGSLPTALPPLGSSPEVYEQNVFRKTKARLEGQVDDGKLAAKVDRLHNRTLRAFLDHDAHFRRINEQAPTVHARLVRLINGFEAHVVDTCETWVGTPQQLTEKIREGLTERIAKELAPSIDETEADHIARLMVARWIAVCELDYG